MNELESVTVNITLTNVSVYCTVSKITLLQWCILSTDLPGIMFVKFFCEKYLLATDKYIMVIPACLHCVQGKHQINEFGPYVKYSKIT